MEPYRYKRLKEPEQGLANFRLLTLLRGAFDDDIHVAVNVHLLPGSLPNYELDVKWYALSYTWGDLQDRSKVTVLPSGASDDGAKPAATGSYISVTKNLTEALRHMRCDYEERLLWADAICIDQGDDDEALRERAWHVQFMHHIYAQATGVIIWLGAEADDSTYVLESLHKLASSFYVNWTTNEIYTLEGEPSESMKYWYDERRSSRDRTALIKLLERPWFDRVWIRQEAFFAKENTSGMFCGDIFVSFADFRKAVHFLSNIGMANPRQNARLALALSICFREFSDEANLLRRIRASDCRDQRDRVYGILGILALTGESGRAVPVQVDYSVSNSVEQVYKDFFLRYIGRYDTLHLLDEAGLWQGSEMRPTWIPDWRMNVMKYQLDLSMESATSHLIRAECAFPEEGILRVLGCCAQQVSKVHVLKPAKAKQLDSDPWEEIDSDLWEELAVLMLGNLGSVQAETAIERFTRVLCCVLNSMNTGLSDLELSREEIREYVAYLYREAQVTSHDRTHVLKPPAKIISEKAAARLVQCVRHLRTAGTPLLFSTERYVGLGPRNAKPGDQICAIPGSHPLILLREVDNNRYEVVGPCFVHGFNWGEAVLGPLPNHYTVVPRFEKTRKGYVSHYLNTETGVASMWDPRIAWEELEAHPPMDNFYPLPAPPEEPLRVRPDSGYLQRHGIKLQQFDLV